MNLAIAQDGTADNHAVHLQECLVVGDAAIVHEDVDGADVAEHGVDQSLRFALLRNAGLLGVIAGSDKAIQLRMRKNPLVDELIVGQLVNLVAHATVAVRLVDQGDGLYAAPVRWLTASPMPPPVPVTTATLPGMSMVWSLTIERRIIDWAAVSVCPQQILGPMGRVVEERIVR
jgi:hypothetical protein